MRPRPWLHAIVAIVSLFFTRATEAQQRPRQDSAASLETAMDRELSIALARPAFATELNRARTQFPRLSTTTELLIAHRGYIGRLGPIGTTPREPRPPVPRLSPEFCRFIPTTCRCMQGDRDACIKVIESDPDYNKGSGFKLGDSFKYIVTCATLQNQYTQVLQAIMTLLGQSPLTAAQLQQLADLQARSNALYNQLVERNCFVST